jgi:dihydroflavonol-4-reductase
LPHFGFSLVDVRDIAALQLLAMTTPSAAGQRFIGSCDFYWMADIAKILKHGLGGQGAEDSIHSRTGFSRPRDRHLRGRLYDLGKRRQVSSEKARRTLGWTTRPVPETILDTARSLQAQGLV